MKRFKSRQVIAVLLGLSLLALLLSLFAVRYLERYPHIPTYGVMGFGFGIPINYQTCGFHTGQDWFASVGTPVYALESGTVIYVGPLWVAGEGLGRGDYSIILHHETDGYYTTYGHNSVALVEEGVIVERGQKIAEIGNEGYSNSPHLHLEKIYAPFTGDWQYPFAGCDGYVDPGNRWDPF